MGNYERNNEDNMIKLKAINLIFLYFRDQLNMFMCEKQCWKWPDKDCLTSQKEKCSVPPSHNTTTLMWIVDTWNTHFSFGFASLKISLFVKCEDAKFDGCMLSNGILKDTFTNVRTSKNMEGTLHTYFDK